MKKRIFVDSNIAIKILFYSNFNNGLLEEIKEKFVLVASLFVRFEVREFGINSRMIFNKKNFNLLFNKIFDEILPYNSSDATKEDFNIKDPNDVQIVLDAILGKCDYILTQDNGFNNLNYTNLEAYPLNKFISENYPGFFHQFPRSIKNVFQDYYDELEAEKKSLIPPRDFGTSHKPVTQYDLIDVIKTHSNQRSYFIELLGKRTLDENQTLDFIRQTMKYSHGNTKLVYNLFMNQYKYNTFDHFLDAYNKFIHESRLEFIKIRKLSGVPNFCYSLDFFKDRQIPIFDANLGRTIYKEGELLEIIYNKSKDKEHLFTLLESKNIDKGEISFLIKNLVFYSSGNSKLAYSIMRGRFDISHDTFMEHFSQISPKFYELQEVKKKKDAELQKELDEKNELLKKERKSKSGPER